MIFFLQIDTFIFQSQSIARKPLKDGSPELRR